MTGFGRGEARLRGGKITVEIKTVNHKFFDDTLKVPENISIFEDRIKEFLQKRIKRGKINLSVTYDGPISKYERIKVNETAARNYYNELLKLKKCLGLGNDIGTKEIMALPGVLSYEAAEGGLTKLWPKIKEAVDRAVDGLVSDREKEGRSIYNDIAKRVRRMEHMVAAIKSRGHINIEEYR